MAAMLVAALAVPQSFGSASLVFACAYALVRWLHIFVFAEANGDFDAGQAIRRLARTALPAPALLIVASLFHGTTQVTLWVVALAIDLAGPYAFGVRGFQVSAGHFAERFGLIVIIALGESIVAIGAADPQALLDLHIGVITAAVLALVISAALWWAYFDVVALVAERRFQAAEGHQRARIARDSYSYLHLPMVAGIVLIALGVKKVIGHVDEPLKVVTATALLGGVALYYTAHVAFRLRNLGTLNRPRLVAAATCLVMIPIATVVPALAAIGMAAALTSAVTAYETVRYAEARKHVRS